MKKENLIYLIGTILVITGVVLEILNVSYGNLISLFSIIAMTLFQTWHVMYLKKRIKELEK